MVPLPHTPAGCRLPSPSPQALIFPPPSGVIPSPGYAIVNKNARKKARLNEIGSRVAVRSAVVPVKPPPPISPLLFDHTLRACNSPASRSHQSWSFMEIETHEPALSHDRRGGTKTKIYYTKRLRETPIPLLFFLPCNFLPVAVAPPRPRLCVRRDEKKREEKRSWDTGKEEACDAATCDP